MQCRECRLPPGGRAIWLCVRGDLPERHGHQGAVAGHRLVFDYRHGMAGAPACSGALACGRQFCGRWCANQDARIVPRQMITGLDHVLLVCPSIDAGEAAYSTLLGREPDWRSHDPGGSTTIIYQLTNTAFEIMAP